MRMAAAAAAASQCSKSWPQISEPGGRVVGQDTRGSTRRGWVVVGGWGRGEGERQMDRSVREAAGLSTGEELCLRSSLPEICCHHADTEWKKRWGRGRGSCVRRHIGRGVVRGGCRWVKESTINRRGPKVMLFRGIGSCELSRYGCEVDESASKTRRRAVSAVFFLCVFSAARHKNTLKISLRLNF